MTAPVIPIPDTCPVCEQSGLEFRVENVEWNTANWWCPSCDSEWRQDGTLRALRGESA